MDQLALDAGEKFVELDRLFLAPRPRGGLGRYAKPLGQIAGDDVRARGCWWHSGHRLVQFGQVAGPRVSTDQIERFGGEAAQLLAACGVTLLQHGLGQEGKVVAARGKRGQLDD